MSTRVVVGRGARPSREPGLGGHGSRTSSGRPLPTAAARDERGAVAAETAAVLPLLVAVTLALVWLVSLAAAQVRVVDAAREAARVAARGEPDAAAVGLGRRVAPEGTTFSVTRSGGRVTVTATAVVDGPGGLLAFLPGIAVDARAVAAEEPR